VAAGGSGPNGLKVLLTTQSLYGGIDWGSNRGPKEFKVIIISMVLLVQKDIVRGGSEC